MLEPEELREQLNLGEFTVEFASNRNISPGQLIPVVTDPVSRKVDLFRWGLVPGWAKDPRIGYKMFNARAETLSEKPSFRVPFLRRRCLIPADGFYEWKLVDGRKSPFLFTLKNGQAFTFAGLWESWFDPAGSELRSCTLITTGPNELIRQYHDRMPVILDESTRWEWLTETNPEKLKALLVPHDANAMDTPVRIENITA
jgi:putative SOS response-associated peptidase YedK